jgi:hypothetical protein
MAPNMLLLAYNPDITGLTKETAAKGSRLHRLYDFIVETQSRRAEQEVARYLGRAGQITRRANSAPQG